MSIYVLFPHRNNFSHMFKISLINSIFKILGINLILTLKLIHEISSMNIECNAQKNNQFIGLWS